VATLSCWGPATKGTGGTVAPDLQITIYNWGVISQCAVGSIAEPVAGDTGNDMLKAS